MDKETKKKLEECIDLNIAEVSCVETLLKLQEIVLSKMTYGEDDNNG